MIDKSNLIYAIDHIFETELGKKVLSKIQECIELNSIQKKIPSGVTVGFSGGSDSVLLLIFLRNLQKNINFPLKAIHINHMIRGAEADSDEEFAKKFCEELKIDLLSLKINVPEIAKKNKTGLEEAARSARYKAFDESLNESNNKYIATAHNATDNLETIIFNLMRGTGTKGLCGISAARDNIIRPLLFVAKSDIVNLLKEANIPFVHDSTNDSTEYSRNYIRHKVIPTLYGLTDSPEDSATRAAINVTEDVNFIEKQAELIYENICPFKKIEIIKLRELDKSIFIRVISRFGRDSGCFNIEKTHYDKIFDLISVSDRFEVSLPSSFKFVADGRYVSFCQGGRKKFSFSKEVTLSDGLTEIPELDIAVALSDNKNEDFSSNVYKFSIQVQINSAIIIGELRLRTKRDGDSYFYGGMTRKLKKLFNDKGIPPEERAMIPVIEDDKGIVWVPGFGVRYDSSEKQNGKWITVYKKV